MRCKVIADYQAETPDGIVTLESGQVIELDKEEAMLMIQAGVITPIAKVAYRLYSDVLGDFLWVVPDESCARALRDVTEPIYTADEVRKLKGLSVEGLRAVHGAKTIFEDSRVESVAPAQGGDETIVPGFRL
jgi:hypothetical protein